VVVSAEERQSRRSCAPASLSLMHDGVLREGRWTAEESFSWMHRI
jgi:hypothetical protein